MVALPIIFGILGYYLRGIGEDQAFIDAAGKYEKTFSNAFNALVKGQQDSIANQINQIAAAREEVDAAKAAVTLATAQAKEMDAALREELKVLQDRKNQIDIQIKAIDGKIAVAFESSDRLINLGRAGQGIQQNVNALERRIQAVEVKINQDSGQAASVIQPEEAGQILRVKQTAAPVENPQGGRQNYDLVFSICFSKNEQCNDNELDIIEKVIYRLNPKWFPINPDAIRINYSDQFRLSLRVWGSTRVTACIYLKGGGRPIVRSGAMNLAGTQYWGPDSSDESDKNTCPASAAANLSSQQDRWGGQVP